MWCKSWNSNEETFSYMKNCNKKFIGYDEASWRERYTETQYYLFNQAAGSSQIYYCTQVWLEEKDSHCVIWIRQLVAIKVSTIRNHSEIAMRRSARRRIYMFLTSLKPPSNVNSANPLCNTALSHLAIAIITSDTNHIIIIDRIREKTEVS